MSGQRLRLPPYLTALRVDSDVMVGLLPPRAVTIEDAPPYLPGLLAYLSESRTRAELTAYCAKVGLSGSEASQLVSELQSSGVVSSSSYDTTSRYARHLLYYDLLGLEADDAQRALAQATVGLVGMGGIGSNVATLLAAAGVGTLVFSDGDSIEQSNLTRQTLYGGDVLGRLKVDVAGERLTAINPEVAIRPVPESIAGTDLFDRHFSDCEFVILSADSPADVHSWTNDAAIRLGFATSNAGYIEAFGVVGPLIDPGRTPCYECFRGQGDLQTQSGQAPEELNANHQAPSFGPLNALVAALQANEVIRHLLGLSVETAGTRLLVDSLTYEVHRERFGRDPNCPCCGHLTPSAADPEPQEPTLAEVYAVHRAEGSQNAIVLDDLIAELLPGAPGRRVLDVGCGTGEQLLRLASAGCRVTGTDVSPDMLAHTRSRVAALGFQDQIALVEGTLPDAGSFDEILCLNVLDHIEEPAPVLAAITALLGNEGRLLVSLPHPTKDGGVWRKEHVGGRWRYREFLVQDYFTEGPVTKSREDPDGEVVIEAITTFHRTTAGWFRLFREAGLRIDDLWEPEPDARYATTQPVLYEKSSRLPYFLVFALSVDGQSRAWVC